MIIGTKKDTRGGQSVRVCVGESLVSSCPLQTTVQPCICPLHEPFDYFNAGIARSTGERTCRVFGATNKRPQREVNNFVVLSHQTSGEQLQR